MSTADDQYATPSRRAASLRLGCGSPASGCEGLTHAVDELPREALDVLLNLDLGHWFAIFMLADAHVACGVGREQPASGAHRAKGQRGHV